MHLSSFIRSHMADILAEWTTFARKTAPADGNMSALALTDHAEAILQAVASDIEQHQSQQQQYAKSQGDDMQAAAPQVADAETAAAIHGRLRHASNFSLLQLSSEFRALRATVLRLWLQRVDQLSATFSDEMVRFNEAIDQALAESIVTYSARDERTRDLFLAVLGHDLRAPIANMAMLGELLIHQTLPTEKLVTLGQRAKRGATMMNTMVTDLLGYTRLQMGAGMPVNGAPCDCRLICLSALADARAMYPASTIEFQDSGDLSGTFDSVRLQQMLTNLLINAAQHSLKGHGITMTATGLAHCIAFTVHNMGSVIPAASLEKIFQPLVQLDPDGERDAKLSTSLGLGLFIARETAIAHGGVLSVTSSTDAGTTFSASLPRQ